MPKANINSGNTDQVTIRHEYHEHQGRRWPVLLWFLAAALVFAVIIVFGGRWVYRSLAKPSKPTVQTVPADANKLPKVPPASGTSGPSKTGVSSQTEQKNPVTTPVNQPLPTTGG